MSLSSSLRWLTTRTTSTLSTVSRGNAFEQKSVTVLEKLSMSLMKVGGKSDGGIDLQGWWYVPVSPGPTSRSHHSKQSTTKTSTSTSPSRVLKWKAPDGTTRHRYRVIGQCKAESKKVGPRYIRELEGVLGRFQFASKPESEPESESEFDGKSSRLSQSDPVVGILVSESEFTRSALLTAYSSKFPLFLLRLPPPPFDEPLTEIDGHYPQEWDVEEPAEIGTAVWNPALGASYGLFKGELEILWERSVHSVQGRPGLWRKGSKVEGWVPPLDDRPIRDCQVGSDAVS